MKQTYPIIRFPERGTILYPFRRHPLVKPGMPEQKLARELSAKLPAGVECLLNACIITTDKQPPYYPDLALVVADKPIRINVEIDEPYRQEWPVYDKDLNIAGTIDLICKDDDGQFTIYDWKRSSKVVNAQGQPIVEGFRGKMSYNGISLPDTSFYHYCIQQNLYRYMLERHYGIKVKAMNLVVLCPDYPTYYVAQVPKMDQLIQQIVTICQQNDLGHRLL